MTVIAHGIDIVEIARIASMLRRHGTRFRQRCFTDAEQAYADSGKALCDERYAARFAAKEAVFKCLGTGWSGGVEWTDVEVSRASGGAPAIVLRGKSLVIAGELGIGRWHLSLSHGGGMAVASAIACRD